MNFAGVVLAFLTAVSVGCVAWQWAGARRFPLHRRARSVAPLPPVTLLKPLAGADPGTRRCLASWIDQDYAGSVEILFGVDSPEDPACGIVHELMRAHPGRDLRLVVCDAGTGTNAKAAKLARLEREAAHRLIVVSDADVRVPRDFLAQLAGLLRHSGVGLVTCLFRLAEPGTLALRWEAVMFNADFWTQVLQARSLRPMDFALGAVMALRREDLERIGGFRVLRNHLADDFQLGRLLARAGRSIALSPVVVDCLSAPLGWRAAWLHQLRWARTIRVCRPAGYFFSLLTNATFWPLLWLAVWPTPAVAAVGAVCLTVRVWIALDCQARLARTRRHWRDWWLVPVKDLSHALLWGLAFLGNEVTWRGKRLRVRPGGLCEAIQPPPRSIRAPASSPLAPGPFTDPEAVRPASPSSP
jgi:ceramide glucosyltransferase